MAHLDAGPDAETVPLLRVSRSNATDAIGQSSRSFLPRSMRSARWRCRVEGDVTSINGTSTTLRIGTKSRTGSYASFCRGLHSGRSARDAEHNRITVRCCARGFCRTEDAARARLLSMMTGLPGYPSAGCKDCAAPKCPWNLRRIGDDHADHPLRITLSECRGHHESVNTGRMRASIVSLSRRSPASSIVTLIRTMLYVIRTRWARELQPWFGADGGESTCR